MNTKAAKLISATYDVSYTTGGNFIQFKLTGGATGDGSRILTDREIADMAYHSAYLNLNGTTWQAPHYNMTGLWHSGESTRESGLFAHRVDLSESSDFGDNWAVYDASGETGEGITITKKSTWVYEYE